LEDGGFADAGSKGREVLGEGRREAGGCVGNFVAEEVEVFLRGGNGTRRKQLLEPRFELRIVGAGQRVALEGKQSDTIVRVQSKLEEDKAVGFAFAEVESRTAAAFETEGVR
jgi:hypothetical protein